MSFSDLLCSHGDGAEIRKSEALAIGDVARIKKSKSRRLAKDLDEAEIYLDEMRLRRDFRSYYEPGQRCLWGEM